MWELDYKESWAQKNWCFWTVVLEKTLESPLDYKEIQPVHPKGDQSWVFIGGTDVEAETPILWPPDVESWLIWKDPDARQDWGQEEKGMTEDEMVGWHHRHNGRRFWWTPGVDDGQGGLTYCGSWGRKESDMTERLNWTELDEGEKSGNTALENSFIRSFSHIHTDTHASQNQCERTRKYFSELKFICLAETCSLAPPGFLDCPPVNIWSNCSCPQQWH